ncbi:LexA family protein [Pelotomaculum propionicicum]|uniref:LexA repressor n=1 Tax=Pelotomaculum propionicicum TaxID=258475 RepID=A0A4Y7RK37_9FIRM|nr:transcriptional regulator [Pelotomaculum propionicicum]NLI12956.1 transcriptional regulator [Peptococcaceae bacterium]TEB09345.1 LexA repressor [Pelotomaculum propionicicum]
MVGPVFNHVCLSNQDLLNAIKNYTERHGYSPTIRELSKITGAGVGTVHKHLNELLYGGYVKVEQPRRRALRVVKDYD